MALETFLARLFPGEPMHIDEYDKAIQALVRGRGKILDLGCGANTSLAHFRKPGLEVWGADFQANPNLQFPQWFRRLENGQRLPFPDQSFDLIASLWVLEHVVQPAKFLQEVQRILKPGGCLVAHTVNAQHYVTFLRRLLDILPHAMVQGLVQRLYRRPEYDTFPTYYRLNTAARVRNFARAAGLRVLALRRYADLGYYFRFSPLLRRLAVLADCLLENMAPGWGRIYFTVILHKPAASNLQTGIGKKRAA